MSDPTPGWPALADCERCSHSSDVHAYPVSIGQGHVTVTESASRYPCLVCPCATFISSEARIRALTSGGTDFEVPPDDETAGETP